MLRNEFDGTKFACTTPDCPDNFTTGESVCVPLSIEVLD
jgi:hypothetical protein